MIGSQNTSQERIDKDCCPHSALLYFTTCYDLSSSQSRYDSIKTPVAKYPDRSCPKCSGYLGVVVPERKQAINGWCLKCGYRLCGYRLWENELLANRLSSL